MEKESFGIKEWCVETKSYEPKNKKAGDISSSKLEDTSKVHVEKLKTSLPQKTVPSKPTYPWGPGSAFMEFFYNRGSVGVPYIDGLDEEDGPSLIDHFYALPSEGGAETENKLLRKELEHLRERVSLIEAALGIRNTSFLHILKVAQETRDTWIANGLRIKIRNGSVKVIDEEWDPSSSS